jgi:TetR/AcrR family transcriptional regulator
MSSHAVRKAARTAGRPPGATGDETRDSILDAALEAFAASGFEAMSVRELTRRLGVSHNLVHHHFGSKLDLWRAALDYGVGSTAKELIELLSGNVGDPEPRRVMAEGLGIAATVFERRPAVIRMLVHETARPGPRLDYLYDHFLGPLIDQLRRFLTESRDEGVRDVDLRAASLFVVSAVSAPFAHEALAAKLGLGAGESRSYGEAMVDLVLGGLMPLTALRDEAG